MTERTIKIENGKIVVCHYESGVTEISAYIDEVIDRAGPILVASARRSPFAKAFTISYAKVGSWGTVTMIGIDRTVERLIEECRIRNAEVARMR